MKITIKPPFRNAGYSLGLKYPLVYGNVAGIGCCVWDRHTGVVVYRPQTGMPWNDALMCNKYAETHNPGYGKDGFSNFEYDSVS